MVVHSKAAAPGKRSAATPGDGAAPTDAEAEHGPSRSASGPPTTVLVVDDEADIVEEVVETLEDEGFRCVSAETGDEALSLLAERADIGIVVSDIRMPGTDGLQMAEQAVKLVERGRELSVIMVTGHAGMAEAIRALRVGVDDFLTKPISADHLIHSVERSRELVRLRWQDRAFKAALELEVAERTREVRDLMAALERQNRDLVLANRAKDEFLNLINHEINTPMNAILGFGQLLRGDLEEAGADAQVDSVDEILKAGRILHRKLQAILTMASVSQGDETLYLDQVNGEEILALVRDAVAKGAAEKGIDVALDLPERPITLVADQGRLLQAVRYLAENAVKYSPDGGAVRLALAPVGDDRVAITVADTGAGMTADQVVVALEPMRRGDPSGGGDQTGGVGLGLPLARTFAEMHGGGLSLESIPGKGTTVTITVPRDAGSSGAGADQKGRDLS